MFLKSGKKRVKTTSIFIEIAKVVDYFFVRSFRYTTSYRYGYLDFQLYRGGGVGDHSSGGGGGEKNRGTVIISLQLAFTERVVPATQAFDWSLDNRC